MMHLEHANDEALTIDFGEAELSSIDASLQRERFSRAMRITVLANLVALYALTLSERTLGVGCFYGLVASQTGLLAARLGISGGLLTRRMATALVALVLHAAALSTMSVLFGRTSGSSRVASFFEGSASIGHVFAVSLAALGLSMSGVAAAAWILSVLGKCRYLEPDKGQSAQLSFSVLHLIAATTLVALLTLFSRWAISVSEIPGMAYALLGLHQGIIFAVAVYYFGTSRDAFRAAFWTILMGLAASFALGFFLGSRGVVFVFEMVQASMIVVWLSAWRVLEHDAVREKLDRFDRSRLARECAKLNQDEEHQLADEGLAEDFKQWPKY
jgi:hypothetical protein